MDANEQAIQMIRAHHAALLEGLRQRLEAMLAAAAAGARIEAARSDMLGYLADEILPHAKAEEETIYLRGRDVPDLRLLLDAMIAEHKHLHALTHELSTTLPPVRASALGQAITDLFAVHADKENDLLLPRLAQEPGVLVHDLLGDMHAQLEG